MMYLFTSFFSPVRPNSGNKPLSQRRNLIEDAVKRHTVHVPVSKFYASQFTQI